MHSSHPRRTARQGEHAQQHKPQRSTHQTPPEPDPRTPQGVGLRQPGGHGGGTAPDPIPNSDVKTTSAHDTAPQGAGKSVAARSSEPHAHTRHRRTQAARAHRQHARHQHNTKDHAGTSKAMRRQATSKMMRRHTGQNVTQATSKAMRRQRGVEQPGSSSGS